MNEPKPKKKRHRPGQRWIPKRPTLASTSTYTVEELLAFCKFKPLALGHKRAIVLWDGIYYG